MAKVAKWVTSTGVTSFVATIVSSPPEFYRRALAKFAPLSGGAAGANVLGLHLEVVWSGRSGRANPAGAMHECVQVWGP